MSELESIFFLGWAFGLLQVWSVGRYMERRHGKGTPVPWFLLLATIAISVFVVGIGNSLGG